MTSAFLQAVGTSQGVLGNITSKLIAHFMMEPLRELQGVFSVVKTLLGYH